jgi:hypothetical protein
MTGTGWPGRVAASALMLATLAAVGHAQESVQERVAALKTALAENAAAQRHYTWIETTQVELNGEVKSTNSMSCKYVAGSSKPDCTQIGAPPAPPKVRGPLRKSIAKDKIKDLKAYMDSVKTLVATYVPPEPEPIQKAQQRGDVAVAPNPSNGTTKVTITNYHQQGDAVAITMRQAERKLVEVGVKTWLNDPSATVTLTVQMITLPNGVTFPAKKVLTAEAKGITVIITSSNFAQAVAQ